MVTISEEILIDDGGHHFVGSIIPPVPETMVFFQATHNLKHKLAGLIELL